MFDYTRNMKLALQDMLRRSALKAAAGVVLLIGLGFLLAALWSFLATGLGWGAMNASLAVGGGFVLLGVVFLLVGARVTHKPPSTDDLKNEIEARLTLATDAAANRARAEMMRVVDGAADRANALMGRASSRASHFVSETEETIRDTAYKIGLTPGRVEAVKDQAQDLAQQAKDAAATNAGSMTKLVGAFAIGMTLAATVSRRGRRDDDGYDEFDDFDDYDDYDEPFA